jgi:hypothetical protein
MKRFFGKLAAIPFRLLADIGDFVRIYRTKGLRQIIWRLTGDSDDCCKLLFHLCKDGVTAQARQITEQTIAESKDALPAAVIGMLEIQFNKDSEAVRRWVLFAEEHRCHNPEMLLLLRLLISAREGQEDEIVIDEILSRNNLPGHFTQAALFSKAWKLTERKQWGEAEEIADKILTIEEQADARLTKWICCMVKGQEQEANAHLLQAKKCVSDSWFKLLVAQGWLHLCNESKAMEWLCEAEKTGVVLKESKTPIGALFHSEKYRAFCEGQVK